MIARRPSWLRGAMFLWFTVVAFPMVIVAGMLATDFARASLAREEVRALADASSTAGAWVFTPGTAQIDCGNGPGQASAVAKAFATTNAPASAPRGTFTTLTAAKLVGNPAVSCTTNSVTTTLSFQVPQSPFANLIHGLFSGNTTAPVQSLSRTAIVCVPGQAPTAGASCTRPLNS